MATIIGRRPDVTSNEDDSGMERTPEDDGRPDLGEFEEEDLKGLVIVTYENQPVPMTEALEMLRQMRKMRPTGVIGARPVEEES